MAPVGRWVVLFASLSPAIPPTHSTGPAACVVEEGSPLSPQRADTAPPPPLTSLLPAPPRPSPSRLQTPTETHPGRPTDAPLNPGPHTLLSLNILPIFRRFVPFQTFPCFDGEHFQDDPFSA